MRGIFKILGAAANNNNNNNNKNDDFYSAVTWLKAITRALTYAKR